MSESDEFLKRWSRRKLEGGDEPPAHPGEDARPDPQKQVALDPRARMADEKPEKNKEKEDEFDLSSLPPVDSITSTTDVSVFLRKGVPAELTREALRRAWVADPAIRDFIGLAENAWDFNDPNAMPGFGPLDLSQDRVREMLANLFRSKTLESESASPPETNEVGKTDAPPAQQIAQNEPDQSEQNEPAPPERPPASDDAAQHESATEAEPTTRRTHGSALPR